MQTIPSTLLRAHRYTTLWGGAVRSPKGAGCPGDIRLHGPKRRPCRGQSAVEQSAYISRTSLYSDYYGMTYNRTAKEDLVGAGVLLPEHAPSEFEDRAVLWNSVEKNEKAKNAQLARSLKYSLPNEWDEATARQVMECFIKEQFVDKGMCGCSGKLDTSGRQIMDGFQRRSL